MNTIQRMIKYGAIAFAIFLTVIIISGIATAAFTILSFLPGTSIKTGGSKENTIDYSESFTEVKSLDIDHSYGELYIKQGEEFKVEADHVTKDFQAEVDSSGKLIISYNDRNVHFLWFRIRGVHNANSRVTIYLPANFTAEEAELSTGAGNVKIEGLQTDYLKISAGAGNIKGTDLTAQKADFNGGVGNITLNDVNFTNATFENGVGNLKISGKLLGRTEIKCGVGDVNLELQGNEEDYDFDIDSGLGTIRLNGEKISENLGSNRKADHRMIIDGGVGNVRIEMKQQ